MAFYYFKISWSSLLILYLVIRPLEPFLRLLDMSLERTQLPNDKGQASVLSQTFGPS